MWSTRGPTRSTRGPEGAGHIYYWTAEGCLVVLTAGGREGVRAEPLDSVEFSGQDLLTGDENERGHSV